jgi:hypothetical protein
MIVDWLGGRMPPRKKAKKAAAHKKRAQRRANWQDPVHQRANKGKDGSCQIVGIGGSAGPLSQVAAMPLSELTETKIDGAVITLVELEGRKDSYARKTPRHPK